MDIQHQKTENVLVLGFGLGSVVDLLDQHPTIKQISAVEMDEVIIDLAKKYLQSALKNKVEFICGDAEKFISTSIKKFDLILFDVFIEDETPLQFIQEVFLNQLRELVSKNGILLFSKIEISVKDEIENTRFGKLFNLIFPNSFSIDTDGNKVFVWMNK